ncbi:MAG TPA: DUF3093 domain-containing protein [Actinomycetospora sp.]|nr:DUF3093 domain-containing protein [Actinomycetospora sp.]
MSAPGPRFTERLWPGPLGWSLVPATGVFAAIMLLPVHPAAAAVGAVVGVVVAAGIAVASAPRVAVEDGELVAGRAHIPVSALGEPTALDRAGVRRALGPGSDARAFACLRAWVSGAVQVPVVDPDDPTPSWLVSTRRPAQLASAISAERQAAHSVQTS